MHSDFVKPLILWYNTQGRDLPWRRTRDPYRIWISEIMLQQTRVEAVKGYYERFLDALPDILSLSECPEDVLMKLWEGLGYYNRVRNMQKAARQIVADYHGEMPDNAMELKKLPGIGDYTAAAIASIAFGMPEPAVDGNVIRVVSRIDQISKDFSSMKDRRELAESLRELDLPKGALWGTLNQAFMDLGAAICLPNSPPICSTCPVRNFCAAHQQGKEQDFPVRPEKKARRIVMKTILLIRDGDRFAIRKRSEKGLLRGLYEFPGLDEHVDEGRAARYAEEICGTRAMRITKVMDARHVFSHVEWQMRGYEIIMSPWEEGASSQDIIYADAAEIERKYPIPSAFAAYAEYLGIRIGNEKRNKAEV